MENKVIKKEEPDYVEGQEFLLNNDQQHKDLLAELNDMIKEYNNMIKKYGDISKEYNEMRDVFLKEDNKNKASKNLQDKMKEKFNDAEGLKTKIKDLENKIANFGSNHYRTFVARLQKGISTEILKTLFQRNGGSFTYPVAQKIFEEANNRGLIFVIAFNKVYLVDPREKEEKKEYSFLKEIGQYLNVDNRVFVNGLACRSGDVQLSNDIINYYWDVLEGKNGGADNIKIIPPINGILSFVSSQQTPVVENTCKVVNAIIDAYVKKCSKKQMSVELKGISQGVDFITKMVGSGHGKEDRLKNAEVTLEIISAHKLTNKEDILKRLQVGSKYNTIKGIEYGCTQNDRMHPIEYIGEIRQFLEGKGIKDINKGYLTDYRGSNQCLSPSMLLSLNISNASVANYMGSNKCPTLYS